MKFSINEINIVCSDGEASLRFYRDVLGFTVDSEEEGCWHMRCGNTAFLLMPFATQANIQQEYCTAPSISIDLVVEDLEAAEAYLRAAGVRIVENPPANANRFFIEDPDGLTIEILSADRKGT